MQHILKISTKDCTAIDISCILGLKTARSETYKNVAFIRAENIKNYQLNLYL